MENQINARLTRAVFPQVASSTRGNIIFLLLSFPLGLIYFLIVVLGLAVGLGTLIIWVGLPILFATLFIIRCMAEVERRMVNSLLHLPVPYRLPTPPEPRLGFLRRFGRMLSDPYTWTSTIYVLLKLPLGILSFVLTLTLSVASAALVLFPLGYLVSLLVNVILLKNGIPSDGTLIPGFIEIHGSFDLVMFTRSFIGVPVGIVLWLFTCALLNSLARASGELANALLGPGVAYVIAQPPASNAASGVKEEQPVYTEYNGK
jgi:Putative sensor